MSERLFTRLVRIAVDSLLVEELHVQFKIKKTLRKEPNTCELSIFNLAPQTRANMQKRGAKVIVEAGYPDTIGQIFSGDARVIDHIREGANWITKVQCGDGERSYRYNRIAESLRPGTSVVDAVAAVVNALGVNGQKALVTVREAISEQFTQGVSLFGPASKELDRLLRGRGLEWSVQDGELQVLPVGDVVPGTEILLNPQTGLIGSPEHGSPSQSEKTDKSQVLKVKSLLQPQIKPGGRLRVEASGIPKGGDFRVVTVEHEGDTQGGAWYTSAECTPIS